MKKALLLSVFTVCVMLAGHAQEVFDMPFASSTYITGINDSGEICGYYTATSGNTIAFSINKYGDTTIISGPGGSNTYCTARGINSKGIVVGSYGSSANVSAEQGYLYFPNPGRHTGGTYTTITGTWGGTNMVPSGITDDTCVAGSYHVGNNNDGALQCFNSTQVTDLRCNNHGTVIPTYMYGLNRNGCVSGYIIEGAEEQCCIYRGPGVWDTFQVVGAEKSRAYSINDNGWVVGNLNNEQTGFIGQKLANQNLTNATYIRLLDAVTVYPLCINNYNDIVGYYQDANGVNHGFIMAKIDLGFRPSRDGYSMRNNSAGSWPASYSNQFDYSKDPYLNNNDTFPHKADGTVWPSTICLDWPDLVNTMKDTCYDVVDGEKVLNMRAYGNWAAWVKPTFQGSCFGYSNTAGQIFDNISWYQNLFPICTLYQNLTTINYPANDTVLAAVHQTQLKQWSVAFMKHQNEHQQDDLYTTIQGLKQSMRNSRGKPHQVLILNIQNTSGSHAVFPYMIKPGNAGQGVDSIYIYDSNNPGRDDMFIIVDQQAGTFQYNAHGTQADWGLGVPNNTGLWLRGLDTVDLGPQYFSHANGGNNTIRDIPYTETFFNDSSIVHAVDDNDSTAVFSADTTLVSSLTIPILGIEGSAGVEPRGLFSNGTLCTLNKRTKTGYDNFVAINGNDYFIRCDRFTGTDTTDDYTVSSGSLGYVNKSSADRGIGYTVDIEDNGSEYNYYLSGLNLAANNKVVVSAYGGQGVNFQNFGPATNYIITTSFITPTGVRAFKDTININSNTSHIIQPHDTTHSGIYILVDTGMQGHYEDTIFVTPSSTQTPNAIHNVNALHIDAWPVPATNKLYVTGPQGLVTYTITDALGRTVAKGETNFGNGLTQQFDVSKLAPGTFIIQGTGVAGKWNYLFVKD